MLIPGDKLEANLGDFGGKSGDKSKTLGVNPGDKLGANLGDFGCKSRRQAGSKSRKLWV